MYLSGDAHRRLLSLHRKYGPVVRVAPNELSYNHPDAWKDIMGRRPTPAGENGRDPAFFSKDILNSIIAADKQNHSRIRHNLSRSFSAQALREQQGIIQHYVDLLIRRLREECDNGRQAINLVRWFNYTTFDVVGDLAFGEPFHCLDAADYVPFVELVFQSIKSAAFLFCARRYPLVESLLMCLIPKDVRRKLQDHYDWTHERVKSVLGAEKTRPGFMEALAGKGSEAGQEKLTMDEVMATSNTLIVAGSETTATVLSAAVYLLTSHPRVLEKLEDEIRSSFSSEEDISMLSVQKLQYTLAVLDESMRMYPAVPTGPPRLIAKGGDTILKQYVPENTVVSVWQWPLYHNPDYFTLPNSFIPERWTGDERFSRDARSAFMPFSHGPRDCLGRNLAYAEMRLILARLIWNFDVRLAEETWGWDERSKVFLLWEKGPVKVYLKPR
ncbi:hypothetical protein KVR01_013365 [Diaporthe batatas]|uniref:uncharacterized protein n=1 Tax=Diaporthe batatas TaxID=748121 RepID=UPI001D05656D|nr:uncharacterized protein KVR01_013365 [Diaporthe batatas]KAG8156760.1 hypothetical protein KVR01_013365 [Diaporthe batatas]